MIRILMLISGLDIGGAHGGAERFGVELSRHLDQQTCQVTLCAFWQRRSKTENYWIEELTRTNVPLFFASQWTGRFSLGDYGSGVKKLVTMYRSHPLDIVHSHYQMGTFAGILLKTLGCTKHVIRTAHVSKEWGFGFVSWLCRQIFTNWLYPILLDAEVGVSRSIVQALSSHPGSFLFRKKPHLIHNAIYPQAFEETDALVTNHDVHLPKDCFLIGSIGRLTDQKGYRYLIAAIPEVLEEVPNAYFVLIGEGENRAHLEQQAQKLGINEHLAFIGQRERVLPLLRRMDVFVLPSIYEGFPTVILESIACGVPVIATDIPGTDELIKNGENGWLVLPKDPRALARAIIESYQKPDLRKKFIENASQTLKSYRIENIAKEYLSLYQTISDKQSPR